MEAGHFYASTGVTLKTAALDANVLTVEVDAEPNVDYEITFIGCEKGASETKVLQTVNRATASYELDENLLFVRSKVVSTKKQENPIEELFFEMAWTQPVQFIE